VGVQEHHRDALPPGLGFAVVTVSDRRRAEDDESGPAIRDLAAGAGHRIAATRLVPNEAHAIQETLGELLDSDGVDVVVLTGGTGLSPRDLTVEAVRPLLERRIEGFGELFRALSFQSVGPAAMLSRATAGLAHGCAVFVLPGSPQAVTLAMERLILPEIGHLLAQARRS
jgi:molybdopterin adenylyltransferase